MTSIISRPGSVRKLAALAIAACVFALASCSSPLALQESPQDATSGSDEGSLSISLSPQSRTLTPDAASLAIQSYEVIATGPDEQGFSEDNLSADFVCTRGKLKVGAWTVKVYGKNGVGSRIYAGSANVTVLNAKTIMATVNLVPAKENGQIDISVTWPTDGSVDGATATIQAAGEAVETLSGIDASAGSWHYTVTKAGGSYTLVVKLTKGGAYVDGIVESVQVYSGCITTGNFTLAPSHTRSYTISVQTPVAELDFGGLSSINATFSGVAGKHMYLALSNARDYGSRPGVVTAQSFSTASFDERWDAPTDNVSGVASEPAVGVPIRLDYGPAQAPFPLPPAKRGVTGFSEPQFSVSYGQNGGLMTGTSTRSFWIMTAAGSWTQVPTTLRAIGNSCYVWVANANFSDSSVATDDNKITTAQALAIAEKFSGTAGNGYHDGIFEWETKLIGYEFGGGPGGSGGKDGDQHIGIVVYDIDEDGATKPTGGVFGFFWGKDWLDQSYIDANNLGMKTNNAELFYIDSYFLDWLPDMSYSTLAHEYQHMINFNSKAIVQNKTSSTWFTELCSMAIEDLLSSSDKLNTPDAARPRARFTDFNHSDPGSSYYSLGLGSWNESNQYTVMASYANAYAFGAYLLRNCGGPAVIARMVRSPYVDLSAVDDALKTVQGQSSALPLAFRGYATALAGVTPPDDSFPSLNRGYSGTVEGIQYTGDAIDIYAYTGSGATVSGPRVNATVDRSPMPAWGIRLMRDSVWDSDLGDTRSYSFSRPDSGDAHIFVYFK